MGSATPAAGDGLVHGLALDGDGGARELSWREIAGGAVDAATPWIHMDFTSDNAQQWLREHSGIDGVVVDALLDDDSRPRVLEHKGGLLIILRGVNLNPGADPEDMVSIRLWLERNRIVSTRRRRLLSVVSLHEALRGGNGPRNSGEFLVMLVERLSDRIGPVIQQLDEAIEAAEGKFDGGQSMAYGGEFSGLRRQSARIRRYLAPQRDALERLSRHVDTILTADQCLALREQADQITRFLEDLDLVRERSMVAQEELLGQLAHEQNRRIYILSLVAAIFLPLSFLTGLMGMNVAGLPGTESPWAFTLLILLMTAAAVGIVVLFKWRRWM